MSKTTSMSGVHLKSNEIKNYWNFFLEKLEILFKNLFFIYIQEKYIKGLFSSWNFFKVITVLKILNFQKKCIFLFININKIIINWENEDSLISHFCLLGKNSGNICRRVLVFGSRSSFLTSASRAWLTLISPSCSFLWTSISCIKKKRYFNKGHQFHTWPIKFEINRYRNILSWANIHSSISPVKWPIKFENKFLVNNCLFNGQV